MARDLLIVESPSKAKTISKYLGGEFDVRATVGHVRDLPKSNKDAIDIDAGFVPKYVVDPEKKQIVAEIKKVADKAHEVFFATDPDREGEAISWHIAELIGAKNPRRVVFHEITEGAIKDAIAHPRPLDKKLVEAQEARRVLDRLVGYDLSGLIWKKVRYGLSAGRVQSPALRIICEREREIRAFVPEDYWTLHATLTANKKDDIEFQAELQPKTEAEADKIIAAGKKSSWTISDVEEKETRRKPRAPFTTSTLQQAASSRLGYSPSITMRLAQKLYEAGHISYMRTDSTALAQDAVTAITALVTKEFGAEYSAPQQYATKSKNAQEAHEAIRPTHVTTHKAGNSPQEQKLYQLIWSRAIASQMADARLMKTKITAKASDATVPLFYANGSRTIFPGWLAADIPNRQTSNDIEDDDVILPKVESGKPLDLRTIYSEPHQTEPPHRYTEAGLVKELEKRDIGRPSTYASIIQTIIARQYVVKQDRSLHPTDTGEVVSEFLEKHFGNIIGDEFTAKMEDSLDEIATGEKEYEKTLRDFYGPFSQQVARESKSEKVTTLGDAPDDITCPTCGGPMVIKLGKNGKFYSCAKFPDCDGARLIDGTEMTKPRETGEACPECKEGKLVERAGKYGTFVACSRYPKCKYTKRDESAAPAGTGVQCPTCKNGMIVERRGRFGPFFSCSNYPKCAFAMKAKPTGNVCELCNSLKMEGTKTIPERCSNKLCPNHKPTHSNKTTSTTS